jgi:hypothetical protein
VKQSGNSLKGRDLIAGPRCPTRADVAAFIALNGGTLTHSVTAPSQPARRYSFTYKCRRGHQATNTLYDFRRQRWCKGCTWNRLTYEECVAYATERQGHLVSGHRDAIKDTDSLAFNCKDKHAFSLTGTHLKKGKWCSDCDRLARRVEESRFAERAALRGGVYLGRDEKKGCNTIRFRCSAEHEFPLLIANFRQGKWCSQCSSGLGERIVRVVMETLFDGAFPRSRPAWLEMGPRSHLELDGYNADLKLAFEHHGRQHYGDVRMRFPTDYAEQRKRDTFKRKQCLAQGVRLIEVPEIFGLTPLSEVSGVVIAECKRLGMRVPKERLSITPDIERAYRTESFETMLALVKDVVFAKGGRIADLDKAATATTYLIPVRIDCGRGHEWPTRIGRIVRGHWCKECYRIDRNAFLDGAMTPEEYGQRYGVTEPKGLLINTEDVRSLASECGVTLLSEQYRSAKRKLSFRCHRCCKPFPLTYDRLKQHRPDRCPTCARKRGGLARRHTIEELQVLASSKSGHLLSWKYHGVFESLRWWCSECEESFVRPADPILQGGWCQQCSRRSGGSKQSATKLARKVAKSVAIIQRRIARKNWTVTTELSKCVKDKELVSLVCNHGEPMTRSVAYLMRKTLKCECERSNRPKAALARLTRLLTTLGWELLTRYEDKNTQVRVRCRHGQVFDRVAGQIKRHSKCECEKRAGSGEKYISQRPSGRYQVSVVINYKSHGLGTFDTLEEAVMTRDEFCRKHGKTP